MNGILTQCPICAVQLESEAGPTANNVYSIGCKRCGTYQISADAISLGIPHIPSNEKYILSGVARAAHERASPLTILESNWRELIDSAPIPDNPIEMIDRILLYVTKRGKTADAAVELSSNEYPVAYAQRLSEFTFLLQKAVDLKFLENVGGDQFRLDTDGWRQLSELRKRQPDTDKAFVAMWFSDETEKLRKAIVNGIEAAGYKAIVVDEADYTGYIMDFVLGQIRESKFVVADFTVEREEQPELENGDELEARIRKGSRGGVYFEAGFANGLGLPVIQTIKNSNISKNRLHFDLEQVNTIRWKDDEIENTDVRSDAERQTDASPRNLSERIYDRIVGTIGRGYYRPPSDTSS